MKAEDCIKGKIVYLKEYVTTAPNYDYKKDGVIIIGELQHTLGVKDGDSIIIETQSEKFRYVDRVMIDLLLTEEEFLVERDRQIEESNRLEAEFSKVESLITDKVKQSSALLSEAAKIAKEFNYELSDLTAICKPLMNAMSDAGWRVSSLAC